MKQTKALVVPDLQWSLKTKGMDKRAMKAVLAYARDHYWDICLQLGDLMDWHWLSKYTEADRKTQENQRWFKEYEGMNKFLDEFVAAVRHKNPNCKIVIIQGNHDWRVTNAINRNPSLEGTMEMEKNLRFKERKIEYWKFWEHRKPYRIGHAQFIHGEYINENHAKTHALRYSGNLYYGHTHDHQLFTKTTQGKSTHAESLGTLSHYDLGYMGKKPSNWMQCFAVFHFRPNGEYNHFVVDIIKHRFTSPEGKTYQG